MLWVVAVKGGDGQDGRGCPRQSGKGLESQTKILENKIKCKGVVVKGHRIYKILVC